MFSAETELAEKAMKETDVREKGDVRESGKETDGTKGIRDTMRVTEQPENEGLQGHRHGIDGK